MFDFSFWSDSFVYMARICDCLNDSLRACHCYRKRRPTVAASMLLSEQRENLVNCFKGFDPIGWVWMGPTKIRKIPEAFVCMSYESRVWIIFPSFQPVTRHAAQTADRVFRAAILSIDTSHHALYVPKIFSQTNIRFGKCRVFNTTFLCTQRCLVLSCRRENRALTFRSWAYTIPICGHRSSYY